MFEAAFRRGVLDIDRSLEAMIWRVTSRYAELGGQWPASSPAALYVLFGGLFQRALLRHLANDSKAIPDLLDEVRRLLPTICRRSSEDTLARAKAWPFRAEGSSIFARTRRGSPSHRLSELAL